MIDERRRYRVVGFDPGSETFGCAVVDYDLRTGEREVVHAKTLLRNDLLTLVDKDRVALNGKSMVGWMRMIDAVKNFIGLYAPDAVSYENAHYKRGRLSAYKSLTTAAALIKHAAWEYNQDLGVYDYQPNQGKVAAGVKPGSKDKDLLIDGLKGVKGLEWADPELLDSLDEHSRDAVANALAHLDEMFGRT